MPKISAVIIAKNEEKNIERCIKSLYEVVDEILVIDGYSTDKTAFIAQKYGAKVIKQEWLGYGASKNWGNEQATYDWILSLDADEALSISLSQKIASIKEQLTATYSFNRITNYCGQWIHYCGWYPDIKSRLFNRNNAAWSLDPVHEKLEIKQGNKVHINADLLHYSYYSIAEHKERSLKYAQKGALKYYQKSKLTLLFKLLLSPCFRFIKMYLFKQGFRDGKMGFIICQITASEVYKKYAIALKQKVIKH